MKTHPKLKTQSRPIFSCGFFRHCTQTALSPTTPHSPSLPITTSDSPPPPPLPQSTQHGSFQPLHKPESFSSSSSSSSTSQSFTQWRVPLANSPLHHHHYSPPPPTPPPPRQNSSSPSDHTPPIQNANLQDLFHIAELQFSTGLESEQLSALYILERSLVPNPSADTVCPPKLMRGIVSNLKNYAGAKPATKILLALCLAEGNRRVAVEAGAVGALVEVAMELEGPAAERALAALELACTVADGAAELRAHALAVPVMVAMMGKMAGRGREYAIGALGVIYGRGGGPVERAEHAPPEEVARAVVLALQGDCTARGRRKGSQLLKALQEYGRPDVSHNEDERLVN
ncbi:hypothetical protein K2173_005893 [Erythroxylum novogranatense]|uniref:U-box domain-containing protein n=1 Tax=Erythroxylum novogranatense TaxID=1862640 RepID=A0AAV8U2X0_9ROSI|nr:hypothetical protein K2173_005893 [Erythroxylum novogranatense]